MRRRKKLLRLLWPAAAATAAVTFPGCESTPQPTTEPPAAATEPAPDPAAEAAGVAEQYAQQLHAALTPRDPMPPAEVQWLRPGAKVGGMTAASMEQVATLSETVVEAPETTPVATPEPAPEPPAPAADAPPTREELLDALRSRIANSNDPALARAIDTALVGVLDPAGRLDRSLLEPLGYEKRDLVERYHHVMRLLADELKMADTYFDRDAFDARLDELFGHMPIRIRRTELCRRVTGFGVYEPFDTRTFLAGRDNKMIVYVELDQFRASDTGDETYEVKLQQELALFNESDGLAVWRNEPVQIVDTSRNRRRDFFVVQLITLPARLSVGKYRLKVRVTDMHGGSVDETSIPIEVVADEALVKSAATH